MMLATSTAVTVIVINVHYRGVFGNQVPKIVRLLVLNWLARAMRLKDRVDQNLTPREKKSNKVDYATKLLSKL